MDPLPLMSKALAQNESVPEANSAVQISSDVRTRHSESKTGQVTLSALIIARNCAGLVVIRLKGFCTEGAGVI